jgi:hypothetical protein
MVVRTTACRVSTLRTVPVWVGLVLQFCRFEGFTAVKRHFHTADASACGVRVKVRVRVRVRIRVWVKVREF